MLKEKMKLVASSGGVDVYCPEGGRLSFFNSPYPAHYACTGIDVYPGGGFGTVVASPVEGEVIGARIVKCPQRKSFEAADYDCVLLLRSLKNPDKVIKILHIEPIVKTGDIVEPGEDLGRLIRSGFFDFWTDPHVHVEVRKPSDPIRARGGFRFERLIKVNSVEAAEDLNGIVVQSKPEYALVSLNKKFEHGIPVDLDGQTGLLDGGIPHYPLFGVHMDVAPLHGGTVRLCGRNIGVVKSTCSTMCVAECCDPIITVNSKRVGLSLYLFPSSKPLVKVIPNELGGLKLKELEEISIVIS